MEINPTLAPLIPNDDKSGVDPHLFAPNCLTSALLSMSMIFISHASEDKEAFVRPLAHALKAHGLRVWYDELTLRPGDSLRRSIDKGLAECAAGVVILSPSFFTKEWPQRELDALFSAEIIGQSRLIPVWHEIGFAEIAKISPLLADRLAIESKEGVEAVASKIAKEFPAPANISGVRLAEIIEGYQYPGMYEGEAQCRACQHRFLRLNAFKEDYCDILDSAADEHLDEDIDDFPPHIRAKLAAEKDRLRGKYDIPQDVYLTSDEPVRDTELGWLMEAICGWASGTLKPESSAELVRELDLQELDEYFVLLGVPNFTISERQRDLLEVALIEIGCGFNDQYTQLLPICEALRKSDHAG